ncbi:MAG: hemerythrin domain-containing protein [Candidatus Sedimenticola sp. (ex Thyasira tokunagai)]
MSALDDVRVRQTEMVSMISDLKSMLKPELLTIGPNVKTAHNLLCTLGKQLKEHLVAEDKGLYPPLLTHEDPKLKSLAWGFISGQKPLRNQFENYHKRWLKNCDFKFTQEFLDETMDVFSAIEVRIEREQSILIPKLEESGLFAMAGAR